MLVLNAAGTKDEYVPSAEHTLPQKALQTIWPQSHHAAYREQMRNSSCPPRAYSPDDSGGHDI